MTSLSRRSLSVGLNERCSLFRDSLAFCVWDKIMFLFFQFPVYVIFSNKRGNPFRKTALNSLVFGNKFRSHWRPIRDLELRRESAFNKATTVELCGTLTTRRRRDLVAKTGPRPLGPRGQLGSTKNQSTEDWPLEGRSARPLSRQRVQQQLTEDAKVNLRSVLVRKLPSELEAREVPALVVPEHSWMQDVPLLVGTNALRVGEGQAEQGALRVRLRKAVVLPPNATSTVEGEVDQLKAAQNSIVGEVGVLEMISQITLPAGFFQFPVYVIFSNKRGNPFRKTALNSLVFGNKFRSHVYACESENWVYLITKN
ncbi:hypothetical protein CAPTEDRAFT_185208 [Capitella teleta]|uniref:Uncharacterized protein n=1 Tax=Capitella teleta TaxID=283909 RepID=R7VLH7_CAPTE|nr:hypothetical protein CAPTEDRAFT_185208 [Capitella teleta]|eukprot:ELU17630.1 hypothetical protein CAPTEDRAFT_185208 [Capitella teleta]